MARDDVPVLCIGDGIATDVQGGQSEGLDTLFVTGGLAADQFGPDVANPDADMLADWLDERMLSPAFAIGYLR
jgi:ribonucleotide monophosphatase NagD (HAD superfamily)